MIKKLILCGLCAIIIAACNNNKNSKTEDNEAPTAVVDTLTYTYDSVVVVSKNTAKNASGVAKATVSYPVFKSEQINTFIKRQVFDFIAKEEKATAYEDIANSFISGYDDFVKNNPDTQQYWFLLIKINVVYQTENYLAVKYINADYSGGAHPNTVITYLNYNPKTNAALTLDSLIANKAQLLNLAEKMFRKNEKLSATAPLTDGYFFENGKFALAQNFYVSKDGLVFVYNPYEIKPYAAGITELVIPFAELKEIAKPNTILTTPN